MVGCLCVPSNISLTLHCCCLLSSAHIPLYLYPFLNTVSKQRPFEYLRLTSLGVIGALVKVDNIINSSCACEPNMSFACMGQADDSDVVHFLLQTEIVPLCLRIMETGSELSKTVATFIVQKMLLDEAGLLYICATAERFYAVRCQKTYTHHIHTHPHTPLPQ